MTEKQQKILQVALKMFATNGFDSTSTKSVADNAGVSEGLIFRHYRNKQGLLDAIIEHGMTTAGGYVDSVTSIGDSKERIKAAIKLPFQIDESEHDFWRLMYALKWQRGIYKNDVFDTLNSSLESAFEILGYNSPKDEAAFIEVIIDGVATSVLLKDADVTSMIDVILNKYELN